MQNRLSNYGGQHAPSIGTDTLHHKDPWDFSVALANAGGQQRGAIGTSTRDQTDAQDQAEGLADFNAALERLCFGALADRAW